MAKFPCVDCGKEITVRTYAGRPCSIPLCRKCLEIRTENIRKGVKNSSAKPLSEAIKSNTKTCSNCQRPYEAKIIILGTTEIELGGGLCYQCRDEVIRKEDEAQRLKELADQEKKTQERNRLIIQKRNEFVSHCGLPARYYTATFETWQTKRAGNVDAVMKQCKEYSEKFLAYAPQNTASLVITISELATKEFTDNPRSWGCGKTHLAASIAHKIIDNWNGNPMLNPVYITTEPDLFARIQSTYNRNDGETEDQVNQHLQNVPMLILDDIGKTERADMKFVQRTLFAIINARYNNCLPIVITANLTKDELLRYLGNASYERLVEMCNSKFMGIKGHSFRLKNN